MDLRKQSESEARAGVRKTFDPRDAEIARLRREVAASREREEALRAEAQDARKHFSDLTSMSRRFASSMRSTVGERHQQKRRLAAQYAISQVLVGARDLDEAAPKVWEVLGERLGWRAGVLWKVERDAGPAVLRHANGWRSSGSSPGLFEAACEEVTFRRGEGLPGRVWERCEPVWVEDFLDAGEVVRARAAAGDGLHGALAFPIVDGEFVGVFELFRREVLPPDEDLIKTARLVGGQIAQFLERRRAEEERDLALANEREARERAVGTLESINDAFFALDKEQRFTYVNRRTERLWGMAREDLMGRKMWDVFPEALGSDFHRTVEQVLREGEPAEYEAVSSIIGIWVSGRVYPSPGGVSVLFHSIEERKKAEEAAGRSRKRATFRAGLADALRPLGDPVRIQAEAARVLGLHLGVDHAFYAEVEPDDEHFLVAADFSDGVPSLAGRHRLRDFGPWTASKVLTGRSLVLEDAAAGPLDEEERMAYAAVGMRAHLGMPLSKGGRTAAFLGVGQSTPREWTTDEVALVEEVAEKARAAVEHAHAQEALHESEKRYRTLFESIDEGFCTIEVLLDENGDPVDYRFCETNPAFEKHTGLLGAQGKTARELVPNLEDWWIETYGRVALTGESASFEDRSDSMGRWFEVYAYRVGEPEDRTVGLLFKDVTERKLAQEALRESEGRLRRAMAIETIGVLFFDPDGGIVDSNDAFLRMVGYDREELEAGTVRWDALTPPEHMPRSLQAIEEFLSTGRTTPYEKEYVRKDGSRWWGLFAATRLGEREGVEFVIDITEAKRAEEALRRSQERFRAIADLVPDLLWSNDPSGATSWYNRRWFEYTGRQMSESEEYGWIYTVHPDDRKASLQAFLDAVDSGRPIRIEHRILGRDGEYRWFLVQSRPLHDEEGRIVRWFGAATDVHEQRVALEALRMSEERYRSLAEATSSIVWTGDKNGRCIEEMPDWEKFTGQTYREYQGLGWLDALHPEDRPPDGLWGEISSSNPEPMEAGYRLRRRDGEYRQIILRGVPILDERGETREWVGTIFDVEDNRRAEEEREDLRQKAERERMRLETILQQMPGGVFVAEPSGHLVLANEGGRSIYGRDVTTVEECTRTLLSYPDGEPILPEHTALARALAGEAVSGTEVYVLRPDGTRRVIRSNAAPIRNAQGDVVAAVKVFDDVTELVRAEEERDRMRERERKAHEQAEAAERSLAYYAGGREERQIISRELHDRVAHSMAVVRQNLELFEVLGKRDPAAAARKLELAKEEAKEALKATRDLSMMLRRSEVEGGLRSALEGLRETTVPDGIGYEVSLKGEDSKVPPHVGNQLFLILREAVRNAVNHSGCGRVEVRVEVEREEVVGTVQDDGQGFEPGGNRTRRGGGLRSMHERAALVGGTFELCSAPDGGIRVEVRAPLASLMLMDEGGR